MNDDILMDGALWLYTWLWLISWWGLGVIPWVEGQLKPSPVTPPTAVPACRLSFQLVLSSRPLALWTMDLTLTGNERGAPAPQRSLSVPGSCRADRSASDWDKWWWRNSVEVEFEPWCCSKVTSEEEEQILTVIKKCNDLEHPASLHSKYFALTDGGDVEARMDGELGRFEKMLREAAQPLVIHLCLTDPLTSARSGRIDVILSWISSQIAAVHVCAWMSDTQAINRQIR